MKEPPDLQKSYLLKLTRWATIAGMKRIIILWVIASLAASASSDPGEVALRFLEKVQAGTIDLNPGGDTAILPEVIGAKKLEITNRYERLANDISGSSLEIAEVTNDKEFAAVLIKQSSIFDPSRLLIIPLALLKQGEDWKVAPVPASFENTTARFQLGNQPRLSELENWMMHRQVTLLDHLKSDSSNKLRAEIRKAINPKDLKVAESNLVVRQFIKACETKDQLRILALLGGLSGELPEDWPNRLRMTNQLTSNSTNRFTASDILTSANTLKSIKQISDETQPRFSIELFNPEDSQFSVISVILSKSSDQFWQVTLADDLSQKNISVPLKENDPSRASKTARNFTDRFIKEFTPSPSGSAEEALNQLSKTLNSRKFHDLIRLNAPLNDTYNYSEAAAMWRKSASRLVIPISLKQDENLAVGLIQIISPRAPQKPETEVVAFQRTPTGWLWIPSPSTEFMRPFEEWVTDTTKKGFQNLEASLMEKISLLELPTQKMQPTSIECETLVGNWLSAAAEGNIEEMIPHLSRLGAPASITFVFQNIGYEVNHANMRQGAKRQIKIYQGELLSGAGIQIRQQNGRCIYPFYPIVRTATGVKILLEIDLFGSENDSRAFLNKAALERFEKSTSPELAQNLKDLFSRFQDDLTRNPE